MSIGVRAPSETARGQEAVRALRGPHEADGFAGMRARLAAALAQSPGWRIAATADLGSAPFAPDLAAWRPGRAAEADPAAARSPAPDWVCEFRRPGLEPVSAATRRELYSAQGVDWIWHVDPEARRIEALAFFRGSWTLFALLGAGDELSIAPFRDLNLPRDLFWPA